MLTCSLLTCSGTDRGPSWYPAVVRATVFGAVVVAVIVDVHVIGTSVVVIAL